MVRKILLGVAVCSATSYASSYMTFESLLDALEQTSPKILQQHIQTKIAKERLRGAQAAYYPTLVLSGTSEYSHKYTDGYTPSNVGNDSLTQTTQYQNSSTLSLTYDLFRFGATDLNVKAATYFIQASKAAECIGIKEQIDTLLEAYVKMRITTMKIGYVEGGVKFSSFFVKKLRKVTLSTLRYFFSFHRIFSFKLIQI